MRSSVLGEGFLAQSLGAVSSLLRLLPGSRPNSARRRRGCLAGKFAGTLPLHVEVPLYLTSFNAQRIKCFADVRLDFPSGDGESYAGWNVILGANATGKTTLLQAMAVALVGASPAMRLVSPTNWVRRGETRGTLEASFLRGERPGRNRQE